MKKTTVSALTIAACFAFPPFAALAEDASVNCDTAKEDIAELEAEKKSSLEQVEKGMTSIMPSTAALHLMTGTQQESKEIASGEYNQRIDAHIELIKSTCGV